MAELFAIPASGLRADWIVTNSFDPGIGQLVDIGFNNDTGTLAVAAGRSTRINLYTTGGSSLGDMALPPVVGMTGHDSNRIGLDFYQGNLLVLNGERNPFDEVYALATSNSSPLFATNTTSADGVAYHAARNSFFVSSFPSAFVARISEFSTAGALLNSFDINNVGLFFSDVAVHPTTGNLFLVGNGLVTYDSMLEYTPTGTFVQEFNLGDLVNGDSVGNNRLSGIAFNPANGHAFVTNAINGSRVFELSPSAVPEPSSLLTLALAGTTLIVYRRKLRNSPDLM